MDRNNDTRKGVEFEPEEEGGQSARPGTEVDEMSKWNSVGPVDDARWAGSQVDYTPGTPLGRETE